MTEIKLGCGCKLNWYIESDGRLRREMYGVTVTFCDKHLAAAIIAENPEDKRRKK
jgi:hypothetical protein